MEEKYQDVLNNLDAKIFNIDEYIKSIDQYSRSIEEKNKYEIEKIYNKLKIFKIITYSGIFISFITAVLSLIL